MEITITLGEETKPTPIVCTCGWMDKAYSPAGAEIRAQDHMLIFHRRSTNSIKIVKE